MPSLNEPAQDAKMQTWQLLKPTAGCRLSKETLDVGPWIRVALIGMPSCNKVCETEAMQLTELL